MLMERVFRSEDLPTADRFDYWRQLVGQTHAPLELRSDNWADFRASQRVIDLGSVTVWPTTFQPVCFRRTPKLIKQSDPEGLHLSLPSSGPLYVTRGEQETVYSPNTLCVVDTSRPVDVRGGDDSGSHTGIGIEVPKALLPLPRNQLDQVVRLRLPAHEGFGALLAQLLTQLSKGTGSYRPEDGPRLGTVAVDLLSALFAHVLDAGSSLPPETHRQTLVLRIRAFIQQHLHDPQLTPRAVASAHHISPGYLHRLFQQEEHTVAAWIRSQRLERARRRLADPTMRATPIHTIGAYCGFPRASDFTRAFRTAYGIPPKEYRQQAQHIAD
ncbi:AraC family transcriptional regulator [Streptomyces spongiae]|uniref:Helix-turn-helix domain-containing protein n=1 Tax=Streptomyces spongiae TaxID=565072 RepID=A0A5N8XCW0_9ACTN|nr:AraC family transcriptional regulator [Streptomyces spongiae]MPY56365.1 helix-turn-helix domain-containing protein [Streptomyces spongiae]